MNKRRGIKAITRTVWEWCFGWPSLRTDRVLLWECCWGDRLWGQTGSSCGNAVGVTVSEDRQGSPAGMLLGWPSLWTDKDLLQDCCWGDHLWGQTRISCRNAVGVTISEDRYHYSSPVTRKCSPEWFLQTRRERESPKGKARPLHTVF